MVWLLLSVAYLAAAVVVYAFVARLPLRGNFLFKFLGCGAVFWLALAAHELQLEGPSLSTLSGLLLFAFGWELCIFLFALVSTSVSVGLLRRLRAGSLTADEITRQYSTEFMVDSRVARLVSDGYLAHSNGRYTLTPHARLVLSVFGLLRRFFRHSVPPVVGERFGSVTSETG
jgi:hypothetical protein